MPVNQALIDEIVSNVLAQLQPLRTPRAIAATELATTTKSPVNRPVASVVPVAAVVPAPGVVARPATTELLAAIITADILEAAVKPGQPLRIGRASILTPSARDWLNSNKVSWTRQDRTGGTTTSGKVRWQIILQTVTPTVRALHDTLRRMTEGWKIDLVGQPSEAVTLAVNRVNTAECDGVVIFTEHAEMIACYANRNERVRAAVVHDTKQWEQVLRTLSANVVCISPVGRTFIELRNLVRDCTGTKPRPPAEA